MCDLRFVRQRGLVLSSITGRPGGLPSFAPLLAYIFEQTQACTAQFLPPALRHSSIALCWALSFRKAVPQVTILPSAATAPHSFSNHASSSHAAPCLEQRRMAPALASFTSLK